MPLMERFFHFRDNRKKLAEAARFSRQPRSGIRGDAFRRGGRPSRMQQCRSRQCGILLPDARRIGPISLHQQTGHYFAGKPPVNPQSALLALSSAPLRAALGRLSRSTRLRNLLSDALDAISNEAALIKAGVTTENFTEEKAMMRRITMFHKRCLCCTVAYPGSDLIDSERPIPPA